MRLDETTPEMKEALKEEAQGCKTPEERMAFLAKNGIELTDEQMEGVAGGRFDPPWMLYKKECPNNPNNNTSVRPALTSLGAELMSRPPAMVPVAKQSQPQRGSVCTRVYYRTRFSCPGS